ncbi:MAG: hypothetical protein ABIW85_11030 [Variovorax sp.]
MTFLYVARMYFVPACAGLLLFSAGASLAQGRIGQKVMLRYGGVLASVCADYLQPQLLFLGDSLVVRRGGKPVLAGTRVQAAPEYFGAARPPEFEAAFTSQVAGADKLAFVFYRNLNGLFVAVEGGPKVMAALPATLKGQRVRHCDPNRNVAPGAKPPPTVGPDTLLADARFKKAYVGALGPLKRERWLNARLRCLIGCLTAGQGCPPELGLATPFMHDDHRPPLEELGAPIMANSPAKKPKAISLHIGLNSVNAAAYSGGPLAACEFDANDVAAIAKKQGMKPTALLTKKATRGAALAGMRRAAKLRLRPTPGANCRVTCSPFGTPRCS